MAPPEIVWYFSTLWYARSLSLSPLLLMKFRVCVTLSLGEACLGRIPRAWLSVFVFFESTEGDEFWS